MEAIKDRLPPQNEDAEKSVLGALMLDKNAIIKVADILEPVDFYQGKHQFIFKAMLDLYAKSEPIDIISLSNRLKEKRKLSEIGGRAELAELVNSVPSSAHVAHYAKIVHQKAILRRLIDVSAQVAEKAFEETQPIENLLDQAEQLIFNISQRSSGQSFISLKPMLTEAFERLDNLSKHDNALRGLSTGFLDLDNKLSGFQKSDLIILAARPSLGKSSLALDIARNIALKEKQSVGIFSLEMSNDQLTDRLICSSGNVPLWKFRTGRLNKNDFQNVNHSIATLSDAPIFIDDSSASNIMQVRTMCRRLQSEHGLGLVIVDYLQLMEGTIRTENRVQEISEISRSLKMLARELNVPILALSQLSRAIEQRGGHPKLSDLRESGSIEQDADVVMFIYREDREQRDSQRKNIADIIIAKHRNGPTGSLPLYFNEEVVSFKNLEKHQYDRNQQTQSLNPGTAKTPWGGPESSLENGLLALEESELAGKSN